MSTHNDQLTFQGPVTRFPDISPPIQDQPEPGLDQDLIPQLSAVTPLAIERPLQ